MYLAFLGFAMIVVFMGLIMAKKLSPFTSLIIIPVLFGLLAGYGWDTLEYAMAGIKDVAGTFSMMTYGGQGSFLVQGRPAEGFGGNGRTGCLRVTGRGRHHHGHDLLYCHDPDL